jgi:hypothetical protein
MKADEENKEDIIRISPDTFKAAQPSGKVSAMNHTALGSNSSPSFSDIWYYQLQRVLLSGNQDII